MNPIQLKSVGLLCLLFVSAVHSWGTACPSCTQDSDFLKAASWNANLVPGISANYQERLNGAIAYFTSPDIAAMGLDLLCLQEVYGSGQQTLIQGLQGAFPHSYAGAPAENNNQCLKVCNAQAITALNGCSASCTDANGGSDCLLNSCNQQFLALDISCQSCITSGQGSASAIINACAAQSDADINNNTTCSLFGGNSGNVILSNQPFIATETLIFNTQGSGMSNALLAKISWRGNNVNFVCTNFLPDDVMPSNAGDLATLNNQQTHELIDWVNAKVPAGEPLIVAGDFNFGPAVGSNAGLFVDNYNLMISAGFTSALIANVPADQVPCTSCNNGKFVSTHIFIKSNTNPEACVNDVNLVGSGQTVNTPNGQVALSDTAGVYATICYAGQPAPTALPTIAPAPVQTEVVVLPVQVVDDSSIRFGETSSGATALPIIMFSVAAGVALYF